MYNAKIINIEDKISDITNVATKAYLNAKINEVKGEISSITDLATETTLNSKINEVKGEIPNITNLAAISALTAVENKIPSVSNLVKNLIITQINEFEKKNTDHNHDKYITTPEFNSLTSGNFTARLKQANLASKELTKYLIDKFGIINAAKCFSLGIF